MNLDFIDSVVSADFQHIVSPFSIYRVQSGGERYYVQIDSENKPTYYMSVTTFCKESYGASAQLMRNYYGVLGTEQAEIQSEIAAHYGTFLHIEIGNFFKMDYSYDFGSKGNNVLLSKVKDYLFANNLHHSLAWEWCDKLQNDMASFIAWVQEKEVEMIAMEFRIASDKYKLAGCIDLVCKANFNRKRVVAQVDFKSGRKGFYNNHILQLKGYGALWNEHYGDVCPVTHYFNWSPKEWREQPTYNFENQTDKPVSFEKRIAVALEEDWFKVPKNYTQILGVVTKNTPISEAISIVEPHEPYKKNA